MEKRKSIKNPTIEQLRKMLGTMTEGEFNKCYVTLSRDANCFVLKMGTEEVPYWIVCMLDAAVEHKERSDEYAFISLHGTNLIVGTMGSVQQYEDGYSIDSRSVSEIHNIGYDTYEKVLNAYKKRIEEENACKLAIEFLQKKMSTARLDNAVNMNELLIM